jgi:hypothetical protein
MLEDDQDTLVLTCLCGLYQYVTRVVDGMKIEHRSQEFDITLPKQGTKRYTVLQIVAKTYPNTIDTAQVVSKTKEPIHDVVARLSVLHHKRLIDKVTESKGIKGGSKWILSDAGVELLGVSNARSIIRGG